MIEVLIGLFIGLVIFSMLLFLLNRKTSPIISTNSGSSNASRSPRNWSWLTSSLGFVIRWGFILGAIFGMFYFFHVKGWNFFGSQPVCGNRTDAKEVVRSPIMVRPFGAVTLHLEEKTVGWRFNAPYLTKVEYLGEDGCPIQVKCNGVPVYAVVDSQFKTDRVEYDTTKHIVALRFECADPRASQAYFLTVEEW